MKMKIYWELKFKYAAVDMERIVDMGFVPHQGLLLWFPDGNDAFKVTKVLHYVGENEFNVDVAIDESPSQPLSKFETEDEIISAIQGFCRTGWYLTGVSGDSLFLALKAKKMLTDNSWLGDFVAEIISRKQSVTAQEGT